MLSCYKSVLTSCAPSTYLGLGSGVKGKLGWEEEFLELAEAVFGQGGRHIIYREAKATSPGISTLSRH